MKVTIEDADGSVFASHDIAGGQLLELVRILNPHSRMLAGRSRDLEGDAAELLVQDLEMAAGDEFKYGNVFGD